MGDLQKDEHFVLLDQKAAARVCEITVNQFRRRWENGIYPKPIKLGKKNVWSYVALRECILQLSEPQMLEVSREAQKRRKSPKSVLKPEERALLLSKVCDGAGRGNQSLFKNKKQRESHSGNESNVVQFRRTQKPNREATRE